MIFLFKREHFIGSFNILNANGKLFALLLRLCVSIWKVIKSQKIISNNEIESLLCAQHL